MAHYSHPTTDGLESLRQFVNTVHFEQGGVEEHLDSPAALEAFLDDNGFGHVEVKPADLRRALEVREALRNVMGANNGDPLDPETLDLLNRTAARAKVVAAFDDNASWRIEPASDGGDRALGQMIPTGLPAVRDGRRQRSERRSRPH